MEELLEEVENIELLKTAEERENDNTTSFESLVAEEGVSMKEIQELAERVEFEE